MNEKELRKLINEVAAEIVAESDADGDGTTDAAELRSIADEMDSGTTDSSEMQNSLDAISANEADGKFSFDEWVEWHGGKDAFDSITNVYDAWLAYVNPERYDDNFQKEDSDIDPADEYEDSQEDEIFSMNESNAFTFDKFMKDINGREDKITQNKKELTENNGDSYARTVQKLYQEDWRNSVKMKGKK